MTLKLTALVFALAIPGAALAHDQGRGHQGPGYGHDRHDQRADYDDRHDRGWDYRGGPRPDVVIVSERDHVGADIESQIRWGLQRGLLTDREAYRLRNQNRELQSLKRRVYRDGRLSRGEAKQLARLEDRVRGELAFELRDNDRRDGRRDTRTAVYVARR